MSEERRQSIYSFGLYLDLILNLRSDCTCCWQKSLLHHCIFLIRINFWLFLLSTLTFKYGLSHQLHFNKLTCDKCPSENNSDVNLICCLNCCPCCKLFQIFIFFSQTTCPISTQLISFCSLDLILFKWKTTLFSMMIEIIAKLYESSTDWTTLPIL